MDIKNEIEIKEELKIKEEIIEISDDDNDCQIDQSFEQNSRLGKIDIKGIYPDIDTIKKIDIKDDPLYIEEEYLENDQYIEEISVLDKSHQSLNNNVDKEEKGDYAKVSLKCKLKLTNQIPKFPDPIKRRKINSDLFITHADPDLLKCSDCKCESLNDDVKKVVEGGETAKCCLKCKLNLSNEISNHLDYIKSNLKINSNTSKIPSAPKLFKCSDCSYESNCIFNLKRHLLTHVNKETSIRSNELKTKEEIEMDKLFKCSKCSYDCNKKEQLERHMLKHKKLFKCYKCGFECNKEAHLETHMLTHKKLYKCSECNYKCYQKASFDNHGLKHGKFKLFQCSNCNYKCNYKINLEIHMQTHANVTSFTPPSHANFKFKCGKCSYKCNLQKSLKLHMLKLHM